MKKSVLSMIFLLSVSTINFSQNVSADEALLLLKAGHERYTSDVMKIKDFDSKRIKTFAGQNPYAIILSCADSRVPPEIIFDETIGALFVIRVAGNVIAPEVLGSIEYAAEHLGTKLLLVLGHENCGAVSAAMGETNHSDNIQSLLNRIIPSVDAAKKNYSGDELLHFSIEQNVTDQIKYSFEQSSILKNLMSGGGFKAVGAVYNLGDGTVTFLE